MKDKTLEWFTKADFHGYEDKYVAIVGEKIVGSGIEPGAVFKKAKNGFPEQEVVLWKVPKKDMLVL